MQQAPIDLVNATILKATKTPYYTAVEHFVNSLEVSYFVCNIVCNILYHIACKIVCATRGVLICGSHKFYDYVR